jgi:hypothetical protein
MLIIDDVIVLDDIVPKQYQDLIENQMLSNEVNWHYMRDITYDAEKLGELNVSIAKPAFAHKFYDRSAGIISPGYGLVLPIVYMACEKIKFHVSEVIAARSFLTIPLPNLQNSVDHPHVDREVSHLVVLYYVTDADGDTVIYDKTFRDVSPANLDTVELNVFKSVSPKKGRAIVFDGSRYHASTRPTNGHRCVVNFGVW